MEILQRILVAFITNTLNYSTFVENAKQIRKLRKGLTVKAFTQQLGELHDPRNFVEFASNAGCFGILSTNFFFFFSFLSLKNMTEDLNTLLNE